jgi:hypothetical protein
LIQCHLTIRPTWPEQRAAGRPVDDFVVIDADRSVGRIYQTNALQEDWFWGASLDVVGETMRGHAPSLDEAKAAFKAAHLGWKSVGGASAMRGTPSAPVEECRGGF